MRNYDIHPVLESLKPRLSDNTNDAALPKDHHGHLVLKSQKKKPIRMLKGFWVWLSIPHGARTTKIGSLIDYIFPFFFSFFFNFFFVCVSLSLERSESSVKRQYGRRSSAQRLPWPSCFERPKKKNQSECWSASESDCQFRRCENYQERLGYWLYFSIFLFFFLFFFFAMCVCVCVCMRGWVRVW